MAKAEMVRKVTVSTVASKTRIQKYLLNDSNFTDTQRAAGEAVAPVCRIIGTAAGYRAGMSDNGEFIKFIGTFRAVDLFPDTADKTASGEVFGGGVCILPNFLNGPLMAALDTTKTPVSFGLKIGVKYDASAATGYVFTVENLMPAQPQSDPLLALEVSMGLADASMLQIPNTPTPTPAPVVAAAPTPAPAAPSRGRK